MSILRLQNGSDIRGVSLSDSPDKITLGKDEAEKIGSAFATWLKSGIYSKRGSLTIAVGYDPRVSGEGLKSSLCKGINSIGFSTVDTGLSSTPSMFMATLSEDIDASIMITASHLPWDRNGFKFFTPEGGLNSKDIREVLMMAEKNKFRFSAHKGINTIKDLNQSYYISLTETIRKRRGLEKPLAGFKIIVDAGNGAGGFYASEVLESLGADTTGSLYLEPDGMFPNHIPNPEDPQAIIPLCKRVLDQKAHLGIIFDTDVDRAALVDSKGKPIARNELIALVSSIILEEFPDSWIVTDSITSNGLKTFIENDLGGHHHRFKRGYRNVIDEAIRLNKSGKECHLAIETSGHAAIMENHFLDDGAYLITRILCKVSELGPDRDITDLIRSLRCPVESKEFRITIESQDFASHGKNVIEDLILFAGSTVGWSVVKENFEGVRVLCDKGNGDGWFLLRMSLHDPVLPLNIESDSEGGVKTTAIILSEFFKKYQILDIKTITNYIMQ